MIKIYSIISSGKASINEHMDTTTDLGDKKRGRSVDEEAEQGISNRRDLSSPRSLQTPYRVHASDASSPDGEAASTILRGLLGAHISDARVGGVSVVI